MHPVHLELICLHHSLQRQLKLTIRHCSLLTNALALGIDWDVILRLAGSLSLIAVGLRESQGIIGCASLSFDSLQQPLVISR
jgi:hypothetical protein